MMSRLMFLDVEEGMDGDHVQRLYPVSYLVCCLLHVVDGIWSGGT